MKRSSASLARLSRHSVAITTLRPLGMSAWYSLYSRWIFRRSSGERLTLFLSKASTSRQCCLLPPWATGMCLAAGECFRWCKLGTLKTCFTLV